MNKWLKDNIMSTLTLGAIIGAAFFIGNNQGRLWSSTESRVVGEKALVDIDPRIDERKRFTDSLEKIKEEKHRKFQDSIDRVRDTLTKRNAVTTYQNKQRLDSVAILLKQMKESLDHTLEHVEH